MAHTNWYRFGTVTINLNSDHVIGVNTKWADIGVGKGDIFTLDGVKIYEVDTVTDNTNLTLKTAFTENSVVNAHYCIIRNFNDISTADIVAQMSELRVEMKTYIDTEMSTLQGKSAYEIAQDNGYTGTQAEWLETLKANGEWSNASSRLSTLETKTTTLEGYNAGTRLTALETLRKNCGITAPNVSNYRVVQYMLCSQPLFRNLGTSIDFSTLGWYTPNINNIDNYARVGDYWELEVGRLIMVGISDGGGVDCALCTREPVAMNDTATTEGGYKGSKMYTELLPALLADVEAEIGADHLRTIQTFEENTNTVDPYGEDTGVGTSTVKIDLFARRHLFRDIHARGYNQRTFPLFTLQPGYAQCCFPWNYPVCPPYWIQDVDEYNPTTNFLVWYMGDLYSAAANKTSNIYGENGARIMANIRIQ